MMGAKIVGIGLILSGAITTCYFAWAWHRVSPFVLMRDEKWPRPTPHPDLWLAALNNHYDAKYPTPPGHIKMHGELDRVRIAVLWCIAASAGVASLGGLSYTSGHFLRAKTVRKTP